MWIRHKVTGRIFPLARKSTTWMVGISLGPEKDILSELDEFFSNHVSEDEYHGDNYEIVVEHTALQDYLLNRMISKSEKD